MNFLSHHKKHLLTITALLALGALGWTNIAHAGIGDTIAAGAEAGLNFVIRSQAGGLYIIFTIAAQLVTWSAKLLNLVIRLQIDPHLPVIAQVWEIVRNFSNMLFIVALIIMAFSTIFDIDALGLPGVSGAKYSGALIGKLIIVALLINFSLVIGGMIIDGANTVNTIFLTALGDFSDRIGQVVNPSVSLLGLLNDVEKGNVANILKTGIENFGPILIARMFFSTVLSMIVVFSLIVAIVFALARIPILWFLLIFAPLAWTSSILPSMRHFNKLWWEKFLGWNIFLPVQLLVMYCGMFVLTQQQKLIGSLTEGFTQQVVKGDIGGALAAPFSIGFEVVFFYFLVGFIFIGATKLALSASKSAGDGIVNVVQAGKDWAYGFPVFSQYRALDQATREGIATIKKEGVESAFPVGSRLGKYGQMLYGGEKGQREQKEAMGRRFGIPGLRDYGIKPQQEFVSEVDKEFKVLKDRETAGQLQIDDVFKRDTYKLDPMNPKGAARRAFLYERGQVDEMQFERDMDAWTKSNPFLAQKMSESAKKANYKQVSPEKLLDMAAADPAKGYAKYNIPSATAARREWFDFLKQEKGNDAAFGKMTPAHLKSAIDIYGGNGTNEAESFKRAANNKRPDVVALYDAQFGETGKRATNPQDARSVMKKAVENLQSTFSKKKPSDMGEMLGDAWKRPLFQKALRRHLEDLETTDPGGETTNAKGNKSHRLGAGQKLKASLENAVRGNKQKMSVLKSIKSIQSEDIPLSSAGGDNNPT